MQCRPLGRLDFITVARLNCEAALGDPPTLGAYFAPLLGAEGREVVVEVPALAGELLELDVVTGQQAGVV